MTKVMVAPIDAPDGALFGYGVNQVTGERIAVSCLQDVPAPAISVPSDNGDHMTTLIVQDSTSYSELMSTVANISASGVSWSGSASVSYLREQANSDTSITLTWTRIARTQDRMIDWTQAKVTSDALETLTSQGADAFMTEFYRSRGALSRVAERRRATFEGGLSDITMGAKFVRYLIVI